MSENGNLPAPVIDAFADLTPKQAAAVKAYLFGDEDTFGNQRASILAAGYAPGTRDVFEGEAVSRAVRAIRRHQLEGAAHVMEALAALAPTAADELMSQLVVGKDLAPVDPFAIFGEDLEDVLEDTDEARLKEINKHNRNIAHFMKERRAAAELILAYAEGTPEQRMRIERGVSKSDIEEAMEDMTPEQFEELGRFLFGDKEKGPEAEAPEPVEVDAEVVED